MHDVCGELCAKHYCTFLHWLEELIVEKEQKRKEKKNCHQKLNQYDKKLDVIKQNESEVSNNMLLVPDCFLYFKY